MFWMRNKENIFPIRTLIWRPDFVVLFMFIVMKLNRYSSIDKLNGPFKLMVLLTGLFAEHCSALNP